MRKLQVKQLTATAAAFGLVSAVTAESWLFFADNAGLLDVPASWYINAPVAAWGLVGIPASILLAERLLHTAYQKPGPITALAAAGTAAGREVPYTKNGKPGSIMLRDAKSIFDAPEAAADRQTIAWRVPIGDTAITIGEVELTRFLELASRRPKYQFSRRYWTKRRRPAIPRVRYDALMRLLTSAGLVEARQSGASGYLVGGIKPHNAVTYLKFESPYRA